MNKYIRIRIYYRYCIIDECTKPRGELLEGALATPTPRDIFHKDDGTGGVIFFYNNCMPIHINRGVKS